jgi:hypothetical protein
MSINQSGLENIIYFDIFTKSVFLGKITAILY